MRTDITLSAVRPDDVSTLAETIYVPAHFNNPEAWCAYPVSLKERIRYRKEEIQWAARGLYSSLSHDDEYVYKACTSDGTPCGFVSWTGDKVVQHEMRHGRVRTPNPAVADRSDLSGAADDQVAAYQTTPAPPHFDAESLAESEELRRKARERALSDRAGRGFIRLTRVSVAPVHHGKGVGTALLQPLCEFADINGFDMVVTSSPVGTSLYSRCGFEATEVVKTRQGNFTCMRRIAPSRMPA
ncbi:hypothetical protein KEM52_006275 [Ascosphaera acerosa]|nr:hypothetical protein KEM52_006275 [Ascosphaera acerosa]